MTGQLVRHETSSIKTESSPFFPSRINIYIYIYIYIYNIYVYICIYVIRYIPGNDQSNEAFFTPAVVYTSLS